MNRLLAEGLVSPDADAALLLEPVHAERVEHLLMIIACGISRQKTARVAPWTVKRRSAGRG